MCDRVAPPVRLVLEHGAVPRLFVHDTHGRTPLGLVGQGDGIVPCLFRAKGALYVAGCHTHVCGVLGAKVLADVVASYLV